jgi:hypothetical protein
MAYKGTAGKSSSGASMSKYDVEVEARLQALESETHTKPTGATHAKIEERLAALEAAVEGLKSAPAPVVTAASGSVEALVAKLNNIPAITEHCTKDPDGVRRLKL